MKKTSLVLTAMFAFLLFLVVNSLLVEGLNLSLQIQSISIYSPENGAVYTDSVSFVYHGLENVEGFRYAVPPFPYGDTRVWASETFSYSLDGQANKTVPKSNILIGLTNGSHSIRLFQFLIYYNDFYMAGIGPQPFGVAFSNTVNFTFVGTVPVISNLTVENRTYNSRSIPLNFTVNEPVTSMSYSLDNKANVTIMGNTTLTDLAEGTHSIIIYANETAGNIGKSDTVFFTVSLPTPTPSPPPSPSPSPTQQPPLEPRQTPDRPKIGDFAPVLIPASIVHLGIVVVGLLVYFRKRRGRQF